MQLIPQDEVKRRRLYHICRSALTFCGLVFVVLFLVSVSFPYNFDLQRLLAFCCIAMLTITLIVRNTAHKLSLVVDCEKDLPELPYRSKLERGFLTITLGVIVMGTVSTLAYKSPELYLLPPLFVIPTQNHIIFTGPGWLKFPIGYFCVLGCIYLLTQGGRIVLDSDDLSYYDFYYWKKQQIAYANIEQVEISYGYDGTYGERSYMEIFSRKSTTPIHINLGSIPGEDVIIIILRVIHQHTPDAKMNELAERMRKGEFKMK